MPIYSFSCEKCGLTKDELRKMGESKPPECPECKFVMSRNFSPITPIFKGTGWTYGSYKKIQQRSKEQGKKFFNRHLNLQEKSANVQYNNVD